MLFQANTSNPNTRIAVKAGDNSANLYIDHIRFREYCPGDIADIDCLDYTYLHDHVIASDDYKAKIEIESNGIVPINGNILFQAGQEINLISGFEVKLGSLFKAEINGCQ